MPLVYVHGVNVRDDAEYKREELIRNDFLRTLVAPRVGIAKDSEVFTPYWGGDGVKFWNGLSVIPDGGEETLGSQRPAVTAAAAERLRGEPPRLFDGEQRALFIDALLDAASGEVSTRQNSRSLAAAYAFAQEGLLTGAANTWFNGANKAQDVMVVLYKDIQEKEREALGGDGLWDMLNEGARRLGNLIPDAASHVVVGLARRPLTSLLARFMGDALVYLAERGSGTAPGPIATSVLAQLRAAAAVAKAKSEPLVVICHSFGGEVLYDILTHYAKDEFTIDAWVTVGSQVGLFEEMSLFLASPGRNGGKNDNEAIEMPSAVKRWINIADTNDVLGFEVESVFTGRAGSVKDYVYDTGVAVNAAHGSYFRWPSFYKRLAARVGA